MESDTRILVSTDCSARELYEKLGLNKAAWSRWYRKNITNNPYAIEGEDWVGFILSMNGNKERTWGIRHHVKRYHLATEISLKLRELCNRCASLQKKDRN